MLRVLGFVFLATLAACGGGAGSSAPPLACTNDVQKQFVLDNMYAWYLWNDLLPPNVDIADHDTPESLLEYLKSFQPLDCCSFIDLAQDDAQFFGEGKFEGFGFSYRAVATDDLRLTRVFSDSPAANGGLGRGQRFLRLGGRSIAEIEAAEGVSAVFANNATLEFAMQNPDGSESTTTITKAVVTIDPLPQGGRIIDMGAGMPPVGYIELAQFISTADAQFPTIFADFIAAGVRDIVIDLRYNGGGLVRTAELLADYLGAFANDGRVFSVTEFNADRAAANNSTTFFTRRPDSIDLSRLIVIASRGTASASEQIANGLDPYFDVWIVGDDTFGKPTGQIGLQFCDKILRPTAFKMSNAAGFGEFFDGLPADCPAADDLNTAVGAADDPNMIAAMSIVNTGACPVAMLPGAQFKTGIDSGERTVDRRDSPERVYADAY